jgi:hypothetical protein
MRVNESLYLAIKLIKLQLLLIIIQHLKCDLWKNKKYFSIAMAQRCDLITDRYNTISQFNSITPQAKLSSKREKDGTN